MKVLICGAGIAGLTLALCLERRNHKTILVEQASGPRSEGYMIDFFASGVDAIEQLDLRPMLERLHRPVSRLVNVDGRGREQLSVSYPTLRRKLFADRHYNFTRGALELALLDELKSRVEIRYSSTIENLTQLPDRVCATLSDGTLLDVDAVIGADGVHSHVRELVFGTEEQFRRLLGFHTAAAVFEGTLDAPIADTFVTHSTPGRQVALFELGDSTAVFFIHRADGLDIPRSRDAAASRLRAIYGDLDWIVPEVLDRCARAQSIYFDAVTQIEMPRWTDGRIALVGDAAACVSLLAGQGASMAVAEALILAEELDGPEMDVAPALLSYERRLRPAIARKQRAGRRIARWLVPRSRFGLVLRNLALRTSTWPVVASILRRKMAAESVSRV